MFDLNVYSVLLLPAFIQGVLFTGLCLLRYCREKKLHDLLLALLLLLLTIRLSYWMLGFAGWYDRHNALTTFMFYFPFNTLILIGPCLYFYFLSLTNRDFQLSRSHWPHFIFPLTLLLLYLIKFLADFLYYQPFPDNEAYQFGTHGPFAELDKTALVYLISYSSLLFYFFIILRNFRGYKSYLVTHFADLQGIELGWLRGLIAFIATALFVLGCFYIADLFIPLSYIVNWYPYLLLGLSIYYISINGYFYSPGLFRHLQFSITKIDEQFKTPALPDIVQWKQNLDKFMVIEQPFLDSEINLALLARKLGTNTQILSKVINEGYGQNFNDYINGLRVKAVIEQFRLQAHEKYNLMGIAWDCGFNSKTTFNRAFKKVTGQTPTVFIEQLGGSDHNLNP